MFKEFSMRFSDQIWQQIEPIFKATINHPFLKELSLGTLKQQAFVFYLEQDALYLIDFARALATVSGRLKELDDIALTLQFAQGALFAERELHQSYFKKFSVHPHQAQSPTCLTYTNYLLTTATTASVEEAIAALLPCFWIYHEVGKHLISLPKIPNNPYQAWIDMYGGNEFETIVQQAIQLTNKYALQTTEKNLKLMQEAFIISSRLEWKFWDSAYHLEQWLPET